MAVLREATLFAAVGLLVGGIDELIVDLLYLRHRRRGAAPHLAELPPPRRRYAMFVAAWDEADVIGRMLATAAARLEHADLAIFVGTYPNDPATADAVAEVALADRRIRPVVGHQAGPTTKAACLNTLWRAMLAEERHTGRPYDAVLIHDAEDVVHAGELHVIDRALDGHDAVQLPVRPLPRGGAHLVGGCYLDEFAEAHGKTMVVRAAIGAGMPLAGVGCAVARPVLDRIAVARGGAPFDPASLTEDYELGLAIAGVGGRATIAHVREGAGGRPVAVEAYFPATLDTAVRQKARWLIGIALAGWDRLGWRGSRSVGDAWMRMRDRRGPLAMLVLLAAYAALALWVAAIALDLPQPALPAWLEAVLAINGALLLWRLGWRYASVARLYGRAEGLRALPRLVVGNIVAMMAARRAVVRYVAMLRGAPTWWDKTAHQFPDVVPDA